jgi:integrase
VIAEARGKTITVPLGHDLIAKTIGPKATVVKLSLRTSDPSEAKSRHASVAAYLEGIWRALRDGPISLTHKQTVAISGELYTSFVGALADDPGEAALWDTVIADNQAALDGNFGHARLMIESDFKTLRSLEARFGGLADIALARRGLVIDDDSRGRLLSQVAKSMNEAAARTKQFAEGDYSPDQVATKFPVWEDTSNPTQTAAPAVSIMALFDGWWAEAEKTGRAISTHSGYRRTLVLFSTFLQHNDATKVAPEDVVRFKDYRLQQIDPRTGRDISPKTVKDGDLAAIKAVFGWAHVNKKLPTNPSKDITLKLKKKPRTRPNYFKSDERNAILELSAAYKPTGHENKKTTLAKQWVPWICAYTGARVGEIAQLRKRDFIKEDGCWVIKITPDAGTVKTKEYREVPIHEHLIEKGLLEVIYNAPSGYLFVNAQEGENIAGKRNALKTRLAVYIRTVVPDPEIAPNHGWRHTFKTLGRDADIDSVILDAITGHAPNTEGARYGEVTMKAKSIAIGKFPRLR